MTGPAGQPTPEQLKARERWQSAWNLPIFVAAIGKVSIVSAVVVLLASLGVYQAEHKTNHEFATVRDALGWGIVTLTTVGYGDDTDRRPG